MKHKVVFNISSAYEVKKALGEGAYGFVCLAVHKASKTEVAIKRIEPCSKPLVCIRTIREIRLLNAFNNHENIITLITAQRPPDLDYFQEVYLIQEYMPYDLHKLMHAHFLKEEHILYIVYQVLRGLKYIHSANVIHRDLKPSNILIDLNCEVKICDFGLARIDTVNGMGKLPMESNLTEYVATRWYRAPEIMLLVTMYSAVVDLWSVGCILAELYVNYPLFPGKDYKDQLLHIFQYLGTPTGRDMNCIKLLRAKSYINLLPFLHKKDVASFINFHPRRIEKYGFNPVSSCGLDLMSKLLTFDPSRRLTAAGALEHPYVGIYHDPDDEPLYPEPLEPESFDIDHSSMLSMGDLKKHLHSQVLRLCK